jgi:hypothetical protein
MGGTCSIHERQEVRRKNWSENLKERDHLEGFGLDGRIILKRTLKK